MNAVNKSKSCRSKKEKSVRDCGSVLEVIADTDVASQGGDVNHVDSGVAEDEEL